MQGHKNILVVDNDPLRRQQLETVLSFVGEHYIACTEEQLNEFYAEAAPILTVIITGDIGEEVRGFIKQQPQTPFITP